MMIAAIRRGLSVAALLWAVSAPAVAADWDFLQTQRWLVRADQTAHHDVAAALCGERDADTRLRLLESAARAGADEARLSLIAARYDGTLWERRRLEAALSAAMSKPRRQVGWVFPQADCALSDPDARPWLD
jgi:hypothetical protein